MTDGLLPQNMRATKLNSNAKKKMQKRKNAQWYENGSSDEIKCLNNVIDTMQVYIML